MGRRVPGSARLAGAGLLLLIVFLSSPGCPARSPEKDRRETERETECAHQGCQPLQMQRYASGFTWYWEMESRSLSFAGRSDGQETPRRRSHALNFRSGGWRGWGQFVWRSPVCLGPLCGEVLEGVNMAEGDTLVSVDYEIFGKVQGVFFRKYTQAEGKKLGLVGWVQNTDRGTVQGQLQGPISKVRPMKEWLESTGSPKSHIDSAKFNNEKVILKLDYSDFQIVK